MEAEIVLRLLSAGVVRVFIGFQQKLSYEAEYCNHALTMLGSARRRADIARLPVIPMIMG